jgi:prolyl-tRNA synthetase
MKTSQTYISTLRDAPAEAVIASHKLMLRAGLIRKLGNGLYTYLPIGLRALRKVEHVIREELDAIGALEFKPTIIIPGDLWRESGRWETMGPQMLKAKNRQGQDMVVSPTAEEAYTAIFRENLTSYKQLPINAYQINTKYRDEIRPRYGVMRGREFIMMDGYSINADDESLDVTYQNYAKAYRRIFKRLGLKIIPVKADSGAMGGNGSEEFMIESPIGDDTLILCPKCGYAANAEKASCASDGTTGEHNEVPAMQSVDAPDVLSITDMENFFHTSAKQFIKVLIYKVINSTLDLTNAPGCKNLQQIKEPSGTYYPVSFFAVCIRGDLDVNETKLAATLKASEVVLADETDVLRLSGAPHGFVGPTITSIPTVVDFSVIKTEENGTVTAQIHDTITGGLKKDIDLIHVEPVRDFSSYINADVRLVKPGDICPVCGDVFYMKKGNELGHIFKLGTKYTKSMQVNYLDENGKQQIPTMGCYGIGVDRTLASIIEEQHDDKGIIWPMSVAPYQVAIVPIKYDGEMKRIADTIYEQLTRQGIEVLLDDRNERPGVKFADMDLLGFPVRIVIGEKNLPNVEFKERAAEQPVLVPADEVVEKTASFVFDKLAQLND